MESGRKEKEGIGLGPVPLGRDTEEEGFFFSFFLMWTLRSSLGNEHIRHPSPGV